MSTKRRVLAMNASDVLPLLAGVIGRVCWAGLCNRTLRIVLITLVLSGAAWKGYQRALPVERLDIRSGGVAWSMEEYEINEQTGRALDALLGRLDAEAKLARLGDGNVVLDGITYHRVYSSKLDAKEWTKLTALSKTEGTDDYIFQAGDHLSRMSVADVRRSIARRETQAREMERYDRSSGTQSIRFYVTPDCAKKLDAKERQRIKDYEEGARSFAEQAGQRELGSRRVA